MSEFAASLRILPAQVLDATYSQESFGSWNVTLRFKGRAYRVVLDGKDLEVFVLTSSTRQRPYEWDAPIWTDRVQSTEFSAPLQSKVLEVLRNSAQHAG